MIRHFLLLLILLLLSCCAGYFIHLNPGMVLITYEQWSAQMPLWCLLVLIGVLVCFSLITLSLLRWLMTRPQSMNNWLNTRRKHRQTQATTSGFISLAQGEWQSAEHLLIKGANQNGTLNYLGAAVAAQAQGADRQRDDYLRLAHDSSQQAAADTAVALTQAKLQLSHGQYEQSLATLKHLLQCKPRQAYALSMLTEVYLALKDWPALIDHLNDLQHHRHVSTQTYEQLMQKVMHGYRERLNEQQASLSAWQDANQQLPKAYRLHHVWLSGYAIKLADESPDEALSLIKGSLKQHWHDTLIQVYAHIRGHNLNKQLAFAESLLKQHALNTSLLLTLGHLCIRAQLWGKAQHYLQQAIQHHGAPEACLLLATLLARDGLEAKRISLLEHGLIQATQKNNPYFDESLLTTMTK